MFIKNLPELIENKQVDISNYYLCDEKTSQVLQRNGFNLVSYSGEVFYYLRTEGLLKFLREGRKEGKSER